MSAEKYTFIDLFAGCGGLSEGFYKLGFEALAHIEINHFACETLKERMRHYGYDNAEKAVLEMDITSEDVIEKIDEVLNKKVDVDLIIGGPPCQSFSSAGRARDEHGMKNDPRNYLFESYVKILNNYRPKFFVFENVTGLLTAVINGKQHINTILAELGKEYKVYQGSPKDIVLNTVNYGVPQVRKRVIILGVRKDIELTPEELYNGIIKTHWDNDMPINERGTLLHPVTVRDAIGDLPSIPNGGGSNFIKFKPKEFNSFLKRVRSDEEDSLTYHISRKNNDLDKERYRVMAQNHWTFSDMLEKCPHLRHPKARVFNNSYTVQFWDEPARTIIAHLYKDGNQFIHPDPTQERSISVREAARLMSFPDNFVFCGSRTEQFKQIGNAVPPLFAEAIAKCLKEKLNLLK